MATQPKSDQKAADAQKAAAIKAVDEAAKAKDEAVAELEKRTGSSQPTPTQREVDLAKVGALDHDEKEDDGSGPDPHNQPLTNERALSSGQGGDYRTRQAEPARAAVPPPERHQDKK